MTAMDKSSVLRLLRFENRETTAQVVQWTLRHVKASVRGIRPYDVVRVVVSLVLLLAAFFKAHDLASGYASAASKNAFPWMTIGSIAFETILALWLIANLSPRVTRCIAIGSFALFAGVSFLRAFAGETSCGCFGSLQINPWWMALFDVAAVAALTVWGSKSHHVRRCSVSDLAILGTGLLVFILSIEYVLWRVGLRQIASGDVVVVNPEDWDGKRFPWISQIDVGNQLRNGEWTVLFFRHDCPKCHEELARYSGLVARHPTSRVAAIEVPPFGSNPGRYEQSSNMLFGRLNDDIRWFVKTPVRLNIRDGKVVRPNAMTIPLVLDVPKHTIPILNALALQ